MAFLRCKEKNFLLLSHQTFKDMTSETTSSSRMDWIIFFVSLVAMILLLKYSNEWFWVALPFVLTYLAKGLKVI